MGAIIAGAETAVSSGRVNYHTPGRVLDPTRGVLGVIDLDAASSKVANRRVRARRIFTEPPYTMEPIETDADVSIVINGRRYFNPTMARNYLHRGGLEYEWVGRVFLNHPFRAKLRACRPGCVKAACIRRGWHAATDLPSNEDWVNKAVAEYKAGKASEVIMLTFFNSSEAWFRPLLEFAQAQFLGRIHYIDPVSGEKSSTTKGSCVTYMGPHVMRFIEQFEAEENAKVYLPSRLLRHLLDDRQAWAQMQLQGAWRDPLVATDEGVSQAV